jgi:hypothetical protein
LAAARPLPQDKALRAAREQERLYVTTWRATDPDSSPDGADRAGRTSANREPRRHAQRGRRLHRWIPRTGAAGRAGLFSNRIHVFDIGRDRKTLALRAVDDQLAAESGYVVPHGVMDMDGKFLVPMIGAATGTTLPGGVVEISDRTGAFKRHFGPGPVRGPGDPGPKYMYDFAALPKANRGISSTFGPPATCGVGIDPGCLGNEVAVWDVRRQKVIRPPIWREQRRADGALVKGTASASLHQRAGHERGLARRRRRPRRVRLPAGARARDRPRDPADLILSTTTTASCT